MGRIKGYPFEVAVTGKKISGVVLSEQVKSFDWKARKVKFIEKANSTVLKEVISMISVIIE